MQAGYIKYSLWIDADGALYVQITENMINTDHPGTHSKLLFKVSEYTRYIDSDNAIEAVSGLNIETGSWEISSDNNDRGFIRAILRQLFPTN